MMDKPELKQVARPGSEQPNSITSESPKRPSTASWRTISLFATPLVLGLVNLVDAYADKHKGFTIGDAHYAQLVGEGEAAKRIAIEQGNSVGRTKKEGIILEAQKHAQEILAGASGKAEEFVLQGDLTDPVIEAQSEATMYMARPRHGIADNLLQITRLALLEHEDIEISINPNVLTDIRYVRENRHHFGAQMEMANRANLARRFVRDIVKSDSALGPISKSLVSSCD